jgi:hypothetical protein
MRILAPISWGSRSNLWTLLVRLSNRNGVIYLCSRQFRRRKV